MRQRASRIGWVMTTVAPWVLAGGLLVSFTASAGIDLSTGLSVARLEAADPLAEPAALVPPLARLTHDRAFEPAPEESAPRTEPKGFAGPAPLVERGLKGDPLVPSRAISRQAAALPQAALARLVLRGDERAVSGAGTLSSVTEPEQGFMRSEGGSDMTLRVATAGRSPAAAASGSTGPARPSPSATPTDGRTPAVPRAVVLASATPAPLDAVPVEIAAVPVPGIAGQAGVAVVPKAVPEHRFAGLVEPDHLAQEQRCLAQAVYFEARSEPEEGQAAVAQVVLNRVKSGLYPSSVCGVVFQNRHRYLACQFTFACEGKSLRIQDSESWRTAQRVATEVMEGRTYLDEVGASTHYHADYVRPRWARRLKKMDVIGRHIFYRLKPGQT